MPYWPVLSVTTERAFSISARLDASTDTPGRTAPDASRGVPKSLVCPQTAAGAKSVTAAKDQRVARSVVHVASLSSLPRPVGAAFSTVSAKRR